MATSQLNRDTKESFAEPEGFDQLISQSNLPVLVVFYAPWCGPSHLMDAVLQQVQTQIPQLQIIKINAESNDSLASRFQIHPLPTLLLFQNGQLVNRIEEERIEALLPADRLIQRLQALV